MPTTGNCRGQGMRNGLNGGLTVARITVEDCLTKVPNRFLLVNMVAKRVRQIREGSEYLVSSPKNEDIVISLREIAAGKIALKSEEDEVPQIEAVEAVEEDALEEQPQESEETGEAELAEERPAEE